MKIKRRKSLPLYLKNKNAKYLVNFENVFVKYFSISRNEYYKNSKTFFLFRSEFKKLDKIIKIESSGKDSTFLYGFKWFYDEKFKIKKGVFVPQPDTEGLIDLLLQEFDNTSEKKVFEIGTGTGIIPIVIAKHRKFEIDSFDISKKATNLALENYYLNLPKLKGRINFINDDFSKYFLNKKYDIIISNPPYVKIGDEKISDWVKKNQPKKSLYAPREELFIFKQIFSLAKDVNDRRLLIFLEFGYDQKEKLEELLRDYKFKSIEFFKDLSNIYRYIKINV